MKKHYSQFNATQDLISMHQNQFMHVQHSSKPKHTSKGRRNQFSPESPKLKSHMSKLSGKTPGGAATSKKKALVIHDSCKKSRPKKGFAMGSAKKERKALGVSKNSISKRNSCIGQGVDEIGAIKNLKQRKSRRTSSYVLNSSKRTNSSLSKYQTNFQQHQTKSPTSHKPKTTSHSRKSSKNRNKYSLKQITGSLNGKSSQKPSVIMPHPEAVFMHLNRTAEQKRRGGKSSSKKKQMVTSYTPINEESNLITLGTQNEVELNLDQLFSPISAQLPQSVKHTTQGTQQFCHTPNQLDQDGRKDYSMSYHHRGSAPTNKLGQSLVNGKVGAYGAKLKRNRSSGKIKKSGKQSGKKCKQRGAPMILKHSQLIFDGSHAPGGDMLKFNLQNILQTGGITANQKSKRVSSGQKSKRHSAGRRIVTKPTGVKFSSQPMTPQSKYAEDPTLFMQAQLMKQLKGGKTQQITQQRSKTQIEQALPNSRTMGNSYILSKDPKLQQTLQNSQNSHNLAGSFMSGAPNYMTQSQKHNATNDTTEAYLSKVENSFQNEFTATNEEQNQLDRSGVHQGHKPVIHAGNDVSRMVSDHSRIEEQKYKDRVMQALGGPQQSQSPPSHIVEAQKNQLLKMTPIITDASGEMTEQHPQEEDQSAILIGNPRHQNSKSERLLHTDNSSNVQSQRVDKSVRSGISGKSGKSGKIHSRRQSVGSNNSSKQPNKTLKINKKSSTITRSSNSKFPKIPKSNNPTSSKAPDSPEISAHSSTTHKALNLDKSADCTYQILDKKIEQVTNLIKSSCSKSNKSKSSTQDKDLPLDQQLFEELPSIERQVEEQMDAIDGMNLETDFDNDDDREEFRNEQKLALMQEVCKSISECDVGSLSNLFEFLQEAIEYMTQKVSYLQSKADEKKPLEGDMLAKEYKLLKQEYNTLDKDFERSQKDLKTTIGQLDQAEHLVEKQDVVIREMKKRVNEIEAERDLELKEGRIGIPKVIPQNDTSSAEIQQDLKDSERENKLLQRENMMLQNQLEFHKSKNVKLEQKIKQLTKDQHDRYSIQPDEVKLTLSSRDSPGEAHIPMLNFETLKNPPQDHQALLSEMKKQPPPPLTPTEDLSYNLDSTPSEAIDHSAHSSSFSYPNEIHKSTKPEIVPSLAFKRHQSETKLELVVSNSGDGVQQDSHGDLLASNDLMSLDNLDETPGGSPIIDFQDEFMQQQDQFSESWREQLRREKRF